jgi:hypothetical protein
MKSVFQFSKQSFLSANNDELSILIISYNKSPNIWTLSLSTLWVGLFGMTLARIDVIALITAIVIAATAITTVPAAAQQHTIHIIKDGTNSYSISGSSSSVGSFDTTYRIAGERSAIRSAENLIISTIAHDFRTSPTIGYIRAGGTSATGTEATHPNPFATPEQITERITSELRRVITEVENNTSQGQHVEIKCDFGMTLEDIRCHNGPLPQAR